MVIWVLTLASGRVGLRFGKPSCFFSSAEEEAASVVSHYEQLNPSECVFSARKL